MRRKALVVVAVVAAAFAGYTLRRSSVSVSGREPVRSTAEKDAEMYTAIARLKAQDALAAATAPVAPTPAPPTPAQPVTSENPLDILNTQSKLALDTALANITTRRAALQKSIEPELALLRQKARLDIEALQNESYSGLTYLTEGDRRLFAERKERRLKDLELSYRKKELDIQAKIRPELDALDASEQEAKSNAALRLMVAQHDIQNYQGMIDRGEIDPTVGRSLQFKAAGKDIPAEAFKPPKE